MIFKIIVVNVYMSGGISHRKHINYDRKRVELVGQLMPENSGRL